MSRYEDKTVTQIVDALEASNQQLPVSLRDDIYQARLQALKQARAENRQKSRIFALPQLAWVGAPAAVVLTFAMLVNYPASTDIPVLPAELFLAEIPTEDLALLEDLEFARWLALQQQVVL